MSDANLSILDQFDDTAPEPDGAPEAAPRDSELPEISSYLEEFSADYNALSRSQAMTILSMDERTPMRSRKLAEGALDKLYETGTPVTVPMLEALATKAGIPGAATVPSRGQDLNRVTREGLSASLIADGYDPKEVEQYMDDMVDATKSRRSGG